MDIFKITNIDYNNRKYNLDVKATGIVSSTKYFPVFNIDNQEYIFKPLSKTKPLSTPLFAYSEVYWSYLINKYIDESTPIYKLAYCKGITKHQEKYYEKGTIVKNIIKEDEKLISILELFKKYPDSLVQIDNYINYCEVQYNYENILLSSFFEERKDLREKLCLQILCSILRRDENYHYENVCLIEKNNQITDIAPMLDMEFSQMFMYPDYLENHNLRFSYYDEGMCPIFKYDNNKSYEENYCIFKMKIEKGSIYDVFDNYHFSRILRNLKIIVKLHPNIVETFIKSLENMREEVKKLAIDFNQEFLGDFSTNDYKLGTLLIKEKKTKESLEYKITEKEILDSKRIFNKQRFNIQLSIETLWNIDKLLYILNILLNLYNNKPVEIKNYNNKTLYNKIKRFDEKELEEIMISTKLKKSKIKQKIN